jgi:SAM-dependent methyltransferase
MLDKFREKILYILSGQTDDDTIKAEALLATDPEYLTNSPLAVGYKTTQEQLSLLLNTIIGYSPNNSILDIGAGRGDLYNFICEFFGKEPANYFGIEQNPLLCDVATKKYGMDLLNSIFTAESTLPKKDWVVACGVFFERKCKTEDRDLQKLLDEIDVMYNAANVAVSFNLLSPINNEIHDGHFYVHPGLIMDMLIEKYQLVSIKHNYSNSVYTVTIYKY